MLKEMLEQINYLNYLIFFFLSHDFCASLRFLWAYPDFECCVGSNWWHYAVGSKCLPKASVSPRGAGREAVVLSQFLDNHLNWVA